MSKPASHEPERAPEPRPTASATIEPVGARAPGPRAHAVRLQLPLRPFDARLANRRALLVVGEAALGALGGADGARYFDIVVREKLVAVEAVLMTDDTPPAEALAAMRQTLADAGYHAALRVVRECADDGCTTTATTDPSRVEAVPSGWHSAEICGKHGYRACPGCDSLYVMTSDNASGQPTAVHCEVCGTVLVEWGATKAWQAELVRRGRTP